MFEPANSERRQPFVLPDSHTTYSAAELELLEFEIILEQIKIARDLLDNLTTPPTDQSHPPKQSQ